MYCPLCKTEYNPDVRICADCNVTLVKSLPEEPELDEINWVAVEAFPGKIYAEMLAEILDNADIAHFIKSDVLTSTFNISGLGSTGGRVKLYVPEPDLEQARELIDEYMD